MTLLDDIINGATDDSVSTANLLRKVQIVAHRLGATDISDWVRSELNGYAETADLPLTRKEIATPVMGVWAGIGGSSATLNLSAGSIPENSRKYLFEVNISQSIAALEDLAAGSEEPTVAWDPLHVALYNQWGDEGTVPSMEMMNLVAARKIMPRSILRGIIDSARNTALDFALELQSADPTAGSTDGPTVADAPIATAVYNTYNTITGHGTNIAVGNDIQQRSEVTANDLSSLLVAARELGLSDDGTKELAAAVLAPERERPNKIAAFMTAVRAGVFAIGTEMTAELLTGQLQPLIDAYLGH